jgi:hypothetical protein
MSTIAFAFTVTYTGPYTKTTLPGSVLSGGSITLDYPDKALSAIAEVLRKSIANEFLAIDPNADVNTTLTTKTVT